MHGVWLMAPSSYKYRVKAKKKKSLTRKIKFLENMEIWEKNKRRRINRIAMNSIK